MIERNLGEKKEKEKRKSILEEEKPKRFGMGQSYWDWGEGGVR